MENKKYKGLSLTALVFSVLPLATFIPVLLNVSLSDSVRTIWAGANIVCVMLGLIISVICVNNNESRSIVNILSVIVSAFWALLMLGMLALALVLNILQ
jgi:hypothetical protein